MSIKISKCRIKQQKEIEMEWSQVLINEDEFEFAGSPLKEYELIGKRNEDEWECTLLYFKGGSVGHMRAGNEIGEFIADSPEQAKEISDKKISQQVGYWGLRPLIVTQKGKRDMINKRANDLPIWGSLHEAVQWALYIPVVFGLSIAFSFFLSLLSIFGGGFEGVFLYLQVPLNAGLMTALFVWLALNLAPREAEITAWVTYSVWSIYLLLPVFHYFEIVFVEGNMPIRQSDVIELLQRISWLVVGVFFLFYWGKGFTSNKKRKRDPVKEKGHDEF